MINYTTVIKQFAEQGEKTGWTYIDIPEDIAQQLVPGNKKSFRVKGKLDEYAFAGVALLPMGQGNFIMPLKAAVRKAVGKKKGAMLNVQLAVDKRPVEIPPAMRECLGDEPKAKAFFESLPGSHRNYFIKWVGDVKSEEAQARRIAQVISALAKKQNFAEMVRAAKAKRDLLK